MLSQAQSACQPWVVSHPASLMAAPFGLMSGLPAYEPNRQRNRQSRKDKVPLSDREHLTCKWLVSTCQANERCMCDHIVGRDDSSQISV
ncbi:hypothetical protein BOTBODRAFT_575688 [Botryobasidium botryosum FD-172 SS1]|uniref:Uncharacterized protein n=1 Tax=Botryobasidium botryosum (strain FD-172 SS1) TaxID=930990 RepID=A0A067MP14_BOTB1|nr:hypothetical protein BOTBODRAFT_575688 [Botryobasidium botryosum FD-172 SS1]